MAVWRDAPLGADCSQYAAIATGLSLDDEFLDYATKIR